MDVLIIIQFTRRHSCEPLTSNPGCQYNTVLTHTDRQASYHSIALTP